MIRLRADRTPLECEVLPYVRLLTGSVCFG